jgi:hypothetical protein
LRTNIEPTPLAADGELEPDPVRALLTRLARAKGKSLRALSKAIGRNPTYLQQFLRLHVPEALPEQVRTALARELDVEPDAFRAPQQRAAPRLLGEPINARLMQEAEAIAQRWITGDDRDSRRRRVELMAAIYTLLELEDNGIPISLRDDKTLRILDTLHQSWR